MFWPMFHWLVESKLSTHFIVDKAKSRLFIPNHKIKKGSLAKHSIQDYESQETF